MVIRRRFRGRAGGGAAEEEKDPPQRAARKAPVTAAFAVIFIIPDPIMEEV